MGLVVDAQLGFTGSPRTPDTPEQPRSGGEAPGSGGTPVVGIMKRVTS
eukprot:CAMPEP_0172042130 /NCGR_PEP_ID=MMETSP1041-20130122/25503_1 /TAXON_ID=464988 /ORGANISM="Hemiselmis andersenii, Strain CCMP439" /LENGTH=47 /DNA_ID= /DNA_START= /DNA_END= /DNA_ORIENTATION=